MFRLAVRNVVARFGRIVLTSLAVIVSTAFLSGTFIFRDTLQKTFDAIFAKTYQNVDAYVQAGDIVESGLGFESRDRVRFDIAAAIEGLPGVADAQVLVSGDAVVIAKDGNPIQRTSRQVAGGTINSGVLSVWKVVSGRAPTGRNEVALDTDTAADGGYSLGDSVKVNSEGGSRTFTLVGLAEYNAIATPGDATWALFDDKTAAEFVDKPGYVEAILVAGDGTLSDPELALVVQTVLNKATGIDKVEVLTGQQITDQSQNSLEKGLAFFTIFLSIFSFIALAVGCFVIYNVFSITAAQRRRENALLRAIGGSKRQVTRMLLLEALAIGLIGSLLGLAAGIGLAAALPKLLNAAGFGLPSRGIAINPFTVGLTLIAGTVTTLTAAALPAFSSGRVPPVAAMSQTAFERLKGNRLRIIGAVASMVLGIATILVVLNGSDSSLLALAVLSIFTGIILLGPVMANPISRVLGAPVQRFRGVSGAMACGNVRRNPRRTARTAAPVLIGVALVAGTSVLGASIKAQLRDTIGQSFTGDYVINSTNAGALSFSQVFVDQLNALPEVGDATGLGFSRLQEAGTSKPFFTTTVNPVTAQNLLSYKFVKGSFADLDTQGLLISTGEAKRRNFDVGSTIKIKIGEANATLTVRGIYESSQIAQTRVINRDLLNNTSVGNQAAFVFLTKSNGMNDPEFRVAVNKAIGDYGIGTLQDRNEFIDGRSDLIDQSLSFIYGLLGLSVVISIFGIVLTMLLAVYERRREIGLLRAIGMTRSQIRTTVRWESILTSLYGAVVGVFMGLILGYVVILALRDQGLKQYAVPTSAIVVIVITAFAVGVIAAVIPAWRATKLNVLTAIGTDA